MTSYEKLHSCYSTSIAIKYAKKKGILEKILLSGIDTNIKHLEDPTEWTDTYTWSKLFRNINDAENLSGQSSAYIIGTKCLELDRTLFSFLLRFTPLYLISANINPHIQRTATKNLNTKIVFKSKNSADVTFIPKYIEHYTQEICDFNKGCIVAVLEHKSFKDIQIFESSCAAKDHSSPCCEFHVTWKPVNSFRQKIYDFFHFRFKDRKTIMEYIDHSHKNVENQYKKTQSLQDFYSPIIENMSEGVLWLDDEKNITFINNGFLKLSNYTFDELIHRSFYEILDTTKRQENVVTFHCQKTESIGVEVTLIGKRGNSITTTTNVKYVKSEHRESGYLVTLRDITEQKKVERKLFVAENRYRSLYENSPAIIIGFDLKGNIIYGNPELEKQSKYSEQELKSMSITNLIGPDSELDIISLINHRLSPPVQGGEVHFKNKDGEWRIIYLQTYPIEDYDSELTGLAGIGIDITETIRLHEQLIQAQRMETLGKMAGGLAHDMKNMLNIITGYNSLIVGKTTDDDIIKFGDNIAMACERTKGLIEKLLTFKININILERIVKAHVSVNTLIREAYSLLLSIIAHPTKIFMELPNSECFIHGDSDKINQCLINLAINARDAVEHLPNGEIFIRLRPVNDEGYVTVEVQDNGHGITPDHISRIFDPFYSTKRHKDGTGLGLSVVYGIMKQHKGKIELITHPGEGTTFQLLFPIHSVPQIHE